MENIVAVYLVDLSKVSEVQIPFLMEQLPLSEKLKLRQYRIEADRLRGAVGKLLLQKVLIEEGYGADVLQKIQRDSYQRPFLDYTLDFNISHSGNWVVLAVGRQLRLGIDVEELRPIDLEAMTPFFTPEECGYIQSTIQPLTTFYAIWTQKEAVLKANGKGLHLALEQVQLSGAKALCEQQEWYLYPLDFHPQYACHLALSNQCQILYSSFEIQLLSTQLHWIPSFGPSANAQVNHSILPILENNFHSTQ